MIEGRCFRITHRCITIMKIVVVIIITLRDTLSPRRWIFLMAGYICIDNLSRDMLMKMIMTHFYHMISGHFFLFFQRLVLLLAKVEKLSSICNSNREQRFKLQGILSMIHHFQTGRLRLWEL